ncbi:MAG: hypothetical protein AB201_02460 [Parcubacteria bacterium C7867-006]|nr:MAG: hypothetical protein AB201_02460 [Parcubacteria bacterium C7867-006]
MFDFIERLRQKSESSKKKIAFLTSFVLVGTIFAVWLSVIYPDFRFREKQKQTAASVEASPTTSFFENIKEGIFGIKNQINNLKESVYSIGTSTYYVSNDTAPSPISEPESNTTEDISSDL